MKDLSAPKVREPQCIEFKIDDDVFQAYPRVGAGILDDVMDLSDFGELLSLNPEDATPEDTVALMKAQRDYNLRLMTFLDTVLLPDSAKLYAERLRSVTHPIERNTSQSVIKYLVEEYSKPHPTEPLSLSTNGHSGINENSTVGVSTTE